MRSEVDESRGATQGEAIWSADRLAAVHAQADKAARVRRMFDAIVPTYELVNRLFSFGRDGAWREEAVRGAEVQAGEAVLDIACGTGDLLRTFYAACGAQGCMVGADFAHSMLVRAQDTSSRDLRWCEADALRLPFADGSFDVTSCAFGVRNFQDLAGGLKEMYRVVRGGGRAVILEFTRPANRVIRAVYEFYSGRIMPVGAALVSGDRMGAYRYLPRSVVSFLGSEEMCARLRGAGFAEVHARPLTFGVVTVYVATK